MPHPEYTMPYRVVFWTRSNPNPQRIGTAEEVVLAGLVWAKNAEDAITAAREACKRDGVECNSILGAEVPNEWSGLVREQMLNDDLCSIDLKNAMILNEQHKQQAAAERVRTMR